MEFFEFDKKKQNTAFESIDDLEKDLMLFMDHLSICYSNHTGEDIEEFVFAGRAPIEEEVDAAFGFPKREHFEDIIDEQANKYAHFLKSRFDVTIASGDSDFGRRLSNIFTGRTYTSFQLFGILLAIAPEFNVKYETIYGHLLDERSHNARATLGLAVDFYRFFNKLEKNDIWLAIDASSPINELLLSRESADTDKMGLNFRLIVNKDMLKYILGGEVGDNRLLPGCQVYERIDEDLFFNNEANDQMYAVCQQSSNTVLVAFGKRGCGRHFNLASASGKSLMAIDLGWYSQVTLADRARLVTEIARQCVCRDLFPVIELKVEDLKNDKYRVGIRELVHQLSRFFSLIGIVSDKNPDETFAGMQVISYEIKAPNSSSQTRYWQYLANRAGLNSEVLDVESLANLYNLTPRQIRDLVGEIMVVGVGRNSEDVKRIISKSLLRTTKMRLDGVAEHLEAGFTLDDLVLPEQQTELIKFITAAVRQRYNVNEKLGFGKKLPYGKGHSLLMYGPPGTGKTMTAQVMANEIGLELFRVDSSKLTDKYIGETQKKIGQLFDAAEDCNAILFFDEADALFGKRTEVSSSNDKHANADVSYLLQRMEQYSGLTILATNHANDFDDAFRRRITYYLNIPIPDKMTRLSLWVKVFPDNVEIANDVDFEHLAEKYDFTGSSIKYVANMATYYASIYGTPINKAAILKGIQLEYAKNGKLFSAYEY